MFNWTRKSTKTYNERKSRLHFCPVNNLTKRGRYKKWTNFLLNNCIFITLTVNTRSFAWLVHIIWPCRFLFAHDFMIYRFYTHICGEGFIFLSTFLVVFALKCSQGVNLWVYMCGSCREKFWYICTYIFFHCKNGPPHLVARQVTIWRQKHRGWGMRWGG